jgi:branched-chain amino acid transport system substrate-binding protein
MLSSLIFAPDPIVTPAFLSRVAAIQNQLRVVSAFLDPSLLPASATTFLREFRSRYQRKPPPAAAYGYESMALLLDAIKRAGDDGDSRAAVIDALLSTTERHSILGNYSIDGNGDTTLDSVTGYRIGDGLPVFPVKLTAQR